jgi:outer membrane protein TolC
VLNLRLDVVRAEVDLARKRVETGVAGRETLIAAQDQLRALEAMQQRYRLDMEEIQVTSAAPRNDLQAPLVAKRDFVRERLMLDIATAERALAAAEQQADRAKQRYEVGIATATERQQADTDLAGARARLQVLAATLDLRARVLKGEIKGDDIASAKRQLELESQLRLLQLQLELTQARLTEARRRAAVGTASDVDIKRQELQVLEQQLEMKRVQQQLQALAMKK